MCTDACFHLLQAPGIILGILVCLAVIYPCSKGEPLKHTLAKAGFEPAPAIHLQYCPSYALHDIALHTIPGQPARQRAAHSGATQRLEGMH